MVDHAALATRVLLALLVNLAQMELTAWKATGDDLETQATPLPIQLLPNHPVNANAKPTKDLVVLVDLKVHLAALDPMVNLATVEEMANLDLKDLLAVLDLKAPAVNPVNVVPPVPSVKKLATVVPTANPVNLAPLVLPAKLVTPASPLKTVAKELPVLLATTATLVNSVPKANPASPVSPVLKDLARNVLHLVWLLAIKLVASCRPCADL